MRTTGCPANKWKIHAQTELTMSVSGIPMYPSVFRSIFKSKLCKKNV